MSILVALLILAIVLLLFAGVALELYTRRGSGIDEHPYESPYDAATQARRLPNRLGGHEPGHPPPT